MNDYDRPSNPAYDIGQDFLRGLRALGLSWSLPRKRRKKGLHGSDGIGTFVVTKESGSTPECSKLDILCSPSKKNKVVEGMFEKSGIPKMNKSL